MRIVFASNRSGPYDLYEKVLNGAVGDAQPLLSAGRIKVPGMPTSWSPDGRWVAYQSNESGRFEIYVRPFHPPVDKSTEAASGAMQWQVSTARGIWPTWQPDGKKIDYIDPAGALMAAPITLILNWNPESTPPMMRGALGRGVAVRDRVAVRSERPSIRPRGQSPLVLTAVWNDDGRAVVSSTHQSPCTFATK